jgi:hypothetical protein
VLLASIAVLALRKRLRARRRRRRTDVRERITGAWQETIDQLYEAGIAPVGDLDALTSEEIAATARHRSDLVAGQIETIGAVAERAVFQTAVAVREADADSIWQAQAKLKNSLARSLTMRQRLAVIARYHRAPRGPRRRH